MEEEPPPQPLCANKRRPNEKPKANRVSRPNEEPHVPCSPQVERAMPAGESGTSLDARSRVGNRTHFNPIRIIVKLRIFYKTT